MPLESDATPRRIAIVHDWLNSYRGGERCLEAICELYPTAEIFTLFYVPGRTGPTIEGHPIHASLLNRLPFTTKYYRHLLPVMPATIERFDLSGFDLVISSSHCVAKGARIPHDAVHVCYCYTPMRYVWDKYDDYFAGKWYEPLLQPVIRYLQAWDVKTAKTVDCFIAISDWVKQRIFRRYQREAHVVYPFVDLQTYRLPTESRHENYYLAVSAFAPYKRIDLAIEACNKLDRELWVVGEGQDNSKLRRLAGPKTKFLGRVSNDELAAIYGNCRALLFPGEEDFGIVPLEAMACGKPVIALALGGCTETVLEGQTGLFFHEPSVPSLCDALLLFEKSEHSFSPVTCRQQAERFSKERFVREFSAIVTSLLARRRNHLE